MMFDKVYPNLRYSEYHYFPYLCCLSESCIIDMLEIKNWAHTDGPEGS